MRCDGGRGEKFRRAQLSASKLWRLHIADMGRPLSVMTATIPSTFFRSAVRAELCFAMFNIYLRAHANHEYHLAGLRTQMLETAHHHAGRLIVVSVVVVTPLSVRSPAPLTRKLAR